MPAGGKKVAFRTWSPRGKGFSAGGFGSASYIQTPFFKTRCSQSNPKQAKQVLEMFPKILPPDHVMKLGKGLLPVTCFWCQSIPRFSSKDYVAKGSVMEKGDLGQNKHTNKKLSNAQYF